MDATHLAHKLSYLILSKICGLREISTNIHYPPYGLSRLSQSLRKTLSRLPTSTPCNAWINVQSFELLLERNLAVTLYHYWFILTTRCLPPIAGKFGSSVRRTVLSVRECSQHMHSHHMQVNLGSISDYVLNKTELIVVL